MGRARRPFGISRPAIFIDACTSRPTLGTTVSRRIVSLITASRYLSEFGSASAADSDDLRLAVFHDIRIRHQPIDGPCERCRSGLMAGKNQRHHFVAQHAVAHRSAGFVAGLQQHREDVLAPASILLPPTREFREQQRFDLAIDPHNSAPRTPRPRGRSASQEVAAARRSGRSIRQRIFEWHPSNAQHSAESSRPNTARMMISKVIARIRG